MAVPVAPANYKNLFPAIIAREEELYKNIGDTLNAIDPTHKAERKARRNASEARIKNIITRMTTAPVPAPAPQQQQQQQQQQQIVLPDGWRENKDTNGKSYYYYFDYDKKSTTQWKIPELAAGWSQDAGGKYTITTSKTHTITQKPTIGLPLYPLSGIDIKTIEADVYGHIKHLIENLTGLSTEEEATKQSILKNPQINTIATKQQLDPKNKEYVQYALDKFIFQENIELIEIAESQKNATTKANETALATAIISLFQKVKGLPVLKGGGNIENAFVQAVEEVKFSNVVSQAGLFGSNNFEAEPNKSTQEDPTNPNTSVKNNNKDNNTPSPAGLFGNNNLEFEPNKSNKGNNKSVKGNTNNTPSPAGLFGNNNFEFEPNKSNKGNNKSVKGNTNNIPSVAGLYGNNNFEVENIKSPNGNGTLKANNSQRNRRVTRNRKLAKNANKNINTPSAAGLFGNNNFEAEPNKKPAVRRRVIEPEPNNDEEENQQNNTNEQIEASSKLQNEEAAKAKAVLNASSNNPNFKYLSAENQASKGISRLATSTSTPFNLEVNKNQLSGYAEGMTRVGLSNENRKRLSGAKSSVEQSVKAPEINKKVLGSLQGYASSPKKRASSVNPRLRSRGGDLRRRTTRKPLSRRRRRSTRRSH